MLQALLQALLQLLSEAVGADASDLRRERVNRLIGLGRACSVTTHYCTVLQCSNESNVESPHCYL